MAHCRQGTKCRLHIADQYKIKTARFRLGTKCRLWIAVWVQSVGIINTFLIFICITCVMCIVNCILLEFFCLMSLNVLLKQSVKV